MFAVGLLGDDDMVRVQVSRDVERLLRNARSRRGPVLPVFAVYLEDEGLWEPLTGLPLPVSLPVAEAGRRFRQSVLDPEVQRSVFRHVRLQAPRLGPLIRRWQEAVEAA